MGTNNHGDTPEEIAEGLKAITNLIRDKQPQAFLVVLTLLPRGHFPNKLRDRNAAVNVLVAEQLKGLLANNNAEASGLLLRQK